MVCGHASFIYKTLFPVADDFRRAIFRICIRLPMLRRQLWTKSRQSRPFSHISESRKKVIFSGIQPTGIPHLGNYLGALRQWVHLQNTADDDATLIYCLVDLHAITVHQNPKHLHQWKRESFATLLAIGLNPERSIIFHQSDV